MSRPRDYSSQSYSPGLTGPVKSFPTRDKIDPSGKSREKDDMVALNDKFIRLIDKVCTIHLYYFRIRMCDSWAKLINWFIMILL